MFNKKPAIAAVSAERQKLAEAIATRDARRAEICAVNTAVATADAAWRGARDKLHAAEAAVPAAQAAAAEFATAQAMGKAGDPPLSVKAARHPADEASEELQAAEGALAAQRQRAADIGRYSSIPEGNVRDAVAALVRTAPETAALVQCVARLQAELADCGGALLALAEARALDLGNVEVPGGSVHGPAKMAVTRLQSPPAHWHDLKATVAAPARWKAALAALGTDAAAALPDVAR